MKKDISLVGARPQFIKEAVVGPEARRRGAWRHMVVRFVQHYDTNMSDILFYITTDQQARLLFMVS